VSATLHAGCVLLDDGGLLIMGPSGAGKSMLAAALVRRWQQAGRFAVHVADDRVQVAARSGRLVARPHPAIAGCLEIRGLGIVPVAHERACVLRGAVELVATSPQRLPEVESRTWAFSGVSLPKMAVEADKWLLDRVEIFWRQAYYEQDGAMSRATGLNFSSRCTR
jgi:serine kinase of HPr protein (carbohydrate metabolism regulator)